MKTANKEYLESLEVDINGEIIPAGTDSATPRAKRRQLNDLAKRKNAEFQRVDQERQSKILSSTSIYDRLKQQQQ